VAIVQRAYALRFKPFFPFNPAFMYKVVFKIEVDGSCDGWKGTSG
jgi:hypothetical protein